MAAEEAKVAEETKAAEEAKVAEETKAAEPKKEEEVKKPMITKEKVFGALKFVGAMVLGSVVSVTVLALLGRGSDTSNIIDGVATDIPPVPMPIPAQIPAAALPEVPVNTVVEQAVEATAEVVNQ